MLCEATCHSPMHDDPKYDHGGDITECMVQHSDWVKLVPVEEPVYKPALCTSKWGHRIGKDNACKVKDCGAVWTERWLVKIGDTDEPR